MATSPPTNAYKLDDCPQRPLEAKVESIERKLIDNRKDLNSNWLKLQEVLYHNDT